MAKFIVAVSIAAALGVGALAQPASASGTYTGRLPQPKLDPKTSTEAERAYYALGQRIYSGKIKLREEVPEADAPAQQKQLLALQALLPERVAKKKNLPKFTGKLTPQQLRALTYYVKRRFTPEADVQL